MNSVKPVSISVQEAETIRGGEWSKYYGIAVVGGAVAAVFAAPVLVGVCFMVGGTMLTIDSVPPVWW